MAVPKSDSFLEGSDIVNGLFKWFVSGVSDSPRHCDLFLCQEASMVLAASSDVVLPEARPVARIIEDLAGVGSQQLVHGDLDPFRLVSCTVTVMGELYVQPSDTLD